MTGPVVAWRRMSRGLMLIGFGVFLLLSAQGLLPRAFWAQALTYWPVLLVALGLRVLFERSRFPWLILLSPLLVMATLAYVARQAPRDPPGDWRPVSFERPAGAERVTLDGRLAHLELDVSTRALVDPALVEGRVASRDARRPSLELESSGDTAIVRARSGRTGPLYLTPRELQLWRLVLSPALPLSLRLDLAFARGTLALSEARLERATLHGAFNDLSLRLGTPASDVTLRLDGAFNAIEVAVPAGVRVRVRRNGAFNAINLQAKDGPLDAPHYELLVEGAFNSIDVHSLAPVSAAAR